VKAIVRKPRTRLVRELCVAVVVAACFGFFAAAVGPLKGLVPVALLQAFLVLTSAAILVRSVAVSVSSLRQGHGPKALGSAIFSAGILVAVALPGAQLLSGSRESRLAILGFQPSNITADVSQAYAIFCLALAAFFLGELITSQTRVANTSTPRSSGGADTKLTYVVLIVMGLCVAYFAPLGDQQQAFSLRGEIQGEGLIALLRWSLPLAVAIGLLRHHWHSKWFALVSLVALAFTIEQGNRSPLLIIAVALGLRLMARLQKPGQSIKVIAVILVLGYAGAAVAVGVSAWRGHVIQGESTSLVGEVAQASTDPFSRLTNAGLDTLDGLILATKADPKAVQASWTDPSKVITGFIPHQWWPNKPDWLANNITEHYLGIGGGGLFLSGPGYAFVIFGGLIGVGACFLILGGASALTFVRLRPASIATTLLAYFLVRFFFGGGDAFDGFHVLGLALVVCFATLVAGVVRRGLSTAPQTPATDPMPEQLSQSTHFQA
jgi:hypothetical protein